MSSSSCDNVYLLESKMQAFENLNRVFEEQIAAVDTGDPPLDEAAKNKLKVEILEKWKNSLVKRTKECVEIISTSKDVLETSISGSSDDASKPSTSRRNLSPDYHHFTQQVESLKKIIAAMGCQSQQALLELDLIIQLFEKQVHHNRSLAKENSELRSDLEKMRCKTGYYNQLADKILANMKEESVDLKRFFAEYESRMQSIENESFRSTQEMTLRLKSLEGELESKNRKIAELTVSIGRFDKSSAASTFFLPQNPCSTPAIAVKVNSDSGSEKNIHLTLHDSREICLTDVEINDHEKMKMLKDGASTMAKLLKDKQKMLRKQRSDIQELQQQMEQIKEHRLANDRLQTTLKEMQIENAKLLDECDKLRSNSDHQMTQLKNEQKQHEGNFARKISDLEKEIEKLNADRQRLIETNHILFNSVSVAYKELGTCISKIVD